MSLSTLQMPTHSHTVGASTTDPAGAVPAHTAASYKATADAAMNPTMSGAAGQSSPHPNMQPYLVLNTCLAVGGLYPRRIQ